ncbi:ankyrin [Penicillium malachiteum]|uniref:ankyrin n=1 Tax=Penicillium malachiteum TaxID=1324776 RepID=UPI002546EDF4|nr:ankyrin [Penicillium malachiteum]KAJ5736935.1 ankyrin [Penicillium malachiteum]
MRFRDLKLFHPSKNKKDKKDKQQDEPGSDSVRRSHYAEDRSTKYPPIEVVKFDSDLHSNTTSAFADPSVLAKIRADQSKETSEQIILAPSPTSCPNDLWEEAFQSLSPEEQQYLNAIIEHAGERADPKIKHMKFPHKGAEALIAIAEEKQDELKSRRWKFNVDGHEIEPRTYTERIISCLSTAGDIGVQLLPQPASIVWPVVKGLMQVPVHANQEIGAALMTAEMVVRYISCGHLYEEIYLEKIEGELRENLKSALVKLYAASLRLLSCALKQLKTPTAKILILAFLDPEKTQDQVSSLENSYSDLIKITQICQAQLNIDIDNRIINFLDKFNDIDSFLQKNFSNLFEQLDEETLSKILDWISPIKESDQHHKFRKGRTRDTCEWILKKQEFQDWEQSMSPALIWLQGTMGTGKTVLTSRVIDHLIDKSQRPQDRVVYYYCRRVNEYEDPENVIRSLFRQLAKPTPTSNRIRRDLQAMFKQMRDHTSQLPIEDCREQLLKSLDQYGQITFVIDGLDECKKETINALLDCIDDLLVNKEHPTRIFLSSRPDWDTKSRFNCWPSIKTDTSDSGVHKDIEKFIDEELLKFACSTRSEYEKYERRIKDRLLEKSNGMFQWVFLQTARLKQRLLPEDVLQGIEEMPIELPKAYENIYHVISEGESQKALVDRAFIWIMCSSAPLTSGILLAGVCLSGDRDTAHSRISEDDMLNFGQNLIVLDESQGLWRFSHASVAEFVEEKKDLWSSQEAHSYAGKVCLRYLMVAYGEPFGDKDIHSCRTSKFITPKIISISGENEDVFPADDEFLHYCRHHWVFHVQRKWIPQRLEVPDPLLELLNAFFSSKARSESTYQRWLKHIKMDLKGKLSYWHDSTSMFYYSSSNLNKMDIRDLYPSNFPVLAICRFGLDAIFAEWWDKGQILPSHTNEKGESLLELACKVRSSLICKRLVENCTPDYYHGRAGDALKIVAADGSCDIVDILLKDTTSLELAQSDHGNALKAAASKGKIEVVKALLGDKAPFGLSEYYENALAAAASNGKLEVVQFLVDKGALVDLQLETDYESVLAAAASWGELEVAQFLIDKGASVDLPLQGHYGSALAAAASRGKLELVQFLVDKGASVNLPLQGLYGSALAAAASSGELAVTQFLVEKGASIDLPLQNTHYGSALAAAASSGELAVTQFLVEKGASIDLPLQGLYGSALAAATSSGELAVTQFLVDKGASIDLPLQTGYYGSALAAAASSGKLELVQFLVGKGASVNLPLQTGHYGSALAAAASSSELAVTQFLVEKGASIDIPLQGRYGSALAAAASSGKLELIQFLVDKGAFVNLPLQGEYINALAAAACNGRFEAFQFLVDKAASANLPLKTGNDGSALTTASDEGKTKGVEALFAAKDIPHSSLEHNGLGLGLESSEDEIFEGLEAPMSISHEYSGMLGSIYLL